MRYTSSRKKGRKVVQSKKTQVVGIKFASGLAANMYRVLTTANIKAIYEGEEFVLIDGFDFDVDSFERTTTKEFANRGRKKILPIKYTPDFVGDGFIIECKGRANEAFPMRWKLFKRWIALNRPDVLIFKPQNQKDCDEVINILLNKLHMSK